VTLVDTSIWIETFRRKSTFDLTAVVAVDEVVTCLPVVQEVLQGFSDELAFRTARESMLAMPIIECPLGEEVFDEAIGLYRTARKNGLTVRSSVDCLIAACALRHGIEVLHRDRDYGHLARVSALRERQA
jgi:predicted nucleic acid-binding protein